jgi:ADP-ribose pyrophosphatase YjhB (NUDIX family)
MTSIISSLASGIREFVPFYKYAFDKTWHNINKQIDVSKLQDVVRNAGGLNYQERDTLVQILDREVRPISSVFGRRFERFQSGLINVDCFAKREGKILVHLRDGKYCLTGGGFVDPEESCMQAAIRELHEESGGCYFENVKLIGFRDSPNHNISALFAGMLKGTPRDNMEASGFAFFDSQDIKKHKFFAGHDRLLRFYFDPKQSSSTIPFLSEQEPIAPTLIPRSDVDRSFISQSLRIVSNELLILTHIFQAQFAPRVNHKDFRDSLDAIGLGWTRKVVEHGNTNWDDNTELGLFIDPILDMSIRISSLFNTRVNTGECGKLYLAADVHYDNQMVRFLLPGIHQHGETFPQALTRILLQQYSIESEPNYDLYGFNENHKDRTRTLLFRVRAKSIPTSCKSLLIPAKINT